MSGRPVPWASWDEWQALRDDLWSNHPRRQEAGLQQVCAWRLRGKLPLGVDVTAHLMDVRRADADWQQSVVWAANAASSLHLQGGPVADADAAAGELPLRLRYSLSLIRLVNGISDSQQRGRVASSVAVLSDAAGLPRALVDVRHEATHNELPSLPLLRTAAESALSWLWDNYWDGQSKALAAATERIGSLLTGLANSWRAATVAGLTAGAGALAAADEDEDEAGDTDGETAGGYSSSEGQLFRRQAMSELRSLVPPAFTHVLLQPILECPVLLPPDLASSSAPQQQQQPQQQQKELVDIRAWRSTMKHLFTWYPRLRLLLLEAALQRLVAETTPSPAPAPSLLTGAGPSEGGLISGAGRRARAYGLWLLRLLPAGSAAPPHTSASAQIGKLGAPTSKQGRASRVGGGGGAGTASKALKKAASTAAAAAGPNRAGSLAGEDGGGGSGNGSNDVLPDGPLTPQQLHVLLSIARASTAASGAIVEQPDLASALRDGAAVQSRILQDVVAAIQRVIAQAEAFRCSGTKRQRQAAAAKGELPSGGNDDGRSGWEKVEQAADTGSGDSIVDGDGRNDPQKEAQHQPRARRWQRCSEWSRCAIGCVPCPLNPNGRLPPLIVPLVAPCAPSQPQPPLESDAAAAAKPGEVTVTIRTVNSVGEPQRDPDARIAAASASEYGNDELEYYMESPEPQETGGSSEPLQEGTELVGDRGVGGDGAPGDVGKEDVEDDSAGRHVACSLFGGLLEQQKQQQQGSSAVLGTAAVGFLL